MVKDAMESVYKIDSL